MNDSSTDAGPRRPNLFIAGAPKTGTTALHAYLSEHPNVFMSPVKEPHFFCDDLSDRAREIRTRDAYLQLFREAGPEHSVLGEASVLYLASTTALRRIREFREDARIVVMVRNPIEIAAAYHATMYFAGDENEPRFERAWELQDERAAGRKMPPLCRDPLVLQYRQIASLGTQLQRARGVFPMNQLKVLVFDDFRNDPGAVYEELLRFLQLPSDGRVDFPRVNERFAPRSSLLARLTHRYWIPEPVRRVGRRFGLHHLHLKLRMMNMRAAHRPEVTPELRSRLAEDFRDEISLLSELLGRNLEHWFAVSRPEAAET
ncbi:sulfotransferase family protein [Maioricimonas rarisocia]|nr:sulfotransferase [Maioricimonas rarisocia]